MPLRAGQAFRKPTVGIAVASVLGVINLWWALSSFTPGPLDLALYALLPSLVPFTTVSAAVTSIGNIVLLIGVVLTAVSHQSGPQVVRATCVLMLGVTILALRGFVWVAEGAGRPRKRA